MKENGEGGPVRALSPGFLVFISPVEVDKIMKTVSKLIKSSSRVNRHKVGIKLTKQNNYHQNINKHNIY